VVEVGEGLDVLLRVGAANSARQALVPAVVGIRGAQIRRSRIERREVG
jgi:hypothetical protein